MKNKLLLAFGILLLSVSLSSCYVDGPSYGYAMYHPAPRYIYSSHPRVYERPHWHERNRGWEKGGGHRSGPARTRRAYRN